VRTGQLARQSRELRSKARALRGKPDDYDPLLRFIGDARFVLIGEATHGTHEFYAQRAAITRRLIGEHGFQAVAVEADWPDAYRVNTYVRGRSSAPDAVGSLAGFERFPAWMWRNRDVVEFVEWLRDYNAGLSADERVGFYGLDLYSMYGSIEAVVGYLDKVDAEAARRARYRYSCFDHYREDSQAYGYAASFSLTRSCEQGAVEQLVELRKQAAAYAQRDGRIAEDDYFYAEQNARLVQNAEQYYRSMFGTRVSSWNLRDRHMVETLERLVAHLDRHGGRSKVVVWEHNSHLGDARATDMGRAGEVNVGQLARERWSKDVVNVGLTTYTGSVTAASEWGGPAERKRVRPALEDSYEELFHDLATPDFMLLTSEASEVLPARKLERAIGVIYRPESERLSHYFEATLSRQFDAVLHFDETTALEPLEISSEWEAGEPPETFPFAE
jgi:erythromycin esterase-like protein